MSLGLSSRSIIACCCCLLHRSDLTATHRVKNIFILFSKLEGQSLIVSIQNYMAAMWPSKHSWNSKAATQKKRMQHHYVTSTNTTSTQSRHHFHHRNFFQDFNPLCFIIELNLLFKLFCEKNSKCSLKHMC